jgi:hypothetical protein
LDLSDLAHLVVVAPLLEPADLVVEAAQVPALAHVVLEAARLPALAHVVLEAAQVLKLLRSQSFSASTARISPSSVQPTYERAPSSR